MRSARSLPTPLLVLTFVLVGASAAVAASRPACPGPRLAGGSGAAGALAACRETRSAEVLDVLVFSRTAGFRHDSIPDAVAMLSSLAADGIRVEATEDPARFTDDVLARFDVVLFANTTGDVLNDEQQAALERFVRSGRGYVGVHSAADTEYGWPWYGRLVGAYFRNHPLLPVDVEVTTEDRDHPSTAHLPPTFRFTDEIYNFDRNPRADHVVLLTVDEEGFIYPNTDGGPSMGADHPIAWYKEFEGGRSFYTNLGHRRETWADPVFRRHLVAGIRWAAGGVQWNRIVLTDRPRNPLAMDVSPDGRVFWVERAGELRVWDPATGRVEIAARLEVSREGENGLLGLVLAPDFATTGSIYLYYSTPDPDDVEAGVADEVGENVLSRFRMSGRFALDLASEEVLLRVPSARINHEGGDLEFGPDGNIYLSVGDNTNPFGDTGGYAPLDQRPGQLLFDAQRTAQNPFDLRGSILRIRPDGAPADDNLYPADGSAGRPEIFVKGTRNPFRIAIDPGSGRLFWGDVGPDAFIDGPQGPRGYDEINFADEPGNFGWPHCIGFNRAYRRYDFASQEVGEEFSCDGFRPAVLAYDYTTVDYLALGRAFDANDDSVTGRTAIAGAFLDEARGPFALPRELEGTLLMTEWTRDLLAAIRVSEDGVLESVERVVPWESFARPIDLHVAPDGALYVLEYGTAFGGNNPDARLSRIEYAPSGALTPIARIDATVLHSGEAPATFRISGAGSSAPNDEIVAWEWDLDGDGAVDATGPEISPTFDAEGTHPVSLTVRSARGARSFPFVRRFFVGNSPPVVTIEEPVAGTKIEEGVRTPFRGTAIDPEEGEMPCDRLVWDVRLGHNAHAHPVAELRGCAGTFVPFLGGHRPGQSLFVAIELRATDRGGPGDDTALTGSTIRELEVRVDGD